MFDPQHLLQWNLILGGGGFRINQQNGFVEKVTVINAIPDAFERSAYLAMVMIADQPFTDANHRTTARAVSIELGNQTFRTEQQIATWLRTAHQRRQDGFGMDILMGLESDTNPIVRQTRRDFIHYLGG